MVELLHLFAESGLTLTVERVTLLWSVPDRMYALSGTVGIPTHMIGAHLAPVLASAIDLANSMD